jgi:hypothetical protein
VPGTCLRRFLDLKGLINKFLESGETDGLFSSQKRERFLFECRKKNSKAGNSYYKLRDGVVTKSNAIELMRLIGLEI